MDATAEVEAKPNHEVVTIDPNKPGRHRPVPASSVPLSVKYAAVEALSKGTKVEDLASELAKNGAVEEAERQKAQIEQEEAAQAEQDRAELYDRYLLAFLRYATGQIEGLTTQDMEDIAFLVPKSAIGLAEWKHRRNG